MLRKQEKNADKDPMRARTGHEENGQEDDRENPPRTTSKSWLTTPKFGSSTSGGGEIEPGPERD